MPKSKLKVEYAIHGYLTDGLTDEEFKESIQSILDEFERKNLLHKNIGQLTWEKEKRNLSRKNKFEKIWILLEQVSPRILKGLHKTYEKMQKLQMRACMHAREKRLGSLRSI